VHRRCPSCWGNGKGVGIATGTQSRVRYYRCQKHIGNDFESDRTEDLGKLVGGGCGHTWNVSLAIVETVIVEKRVVAVEMRDVQVATRSNSSK